MAGVKLSLPFAKKLQGIVRAFDGEADDLRGKPGGKVFRHPPQQLFAVKATIDGGAAGSVSATCTWTYTVKLDSGYSLGTGMTPIKCRLPNVPYEGAVDDETWGAGFFDKAGVFSLWDANECPQVEDPCPEEFA